MGKIFITDEINDTYTANVTPGKALRVDDSGNVFFRVTSAHTLVCATSASSGACFLKSVIVGDCPATAAILQVWDTAVCASNVTAFGTSGSNVIAMLGLNASASVSGDPAKYPLTIPLNVYCTTGVSIGISHSAVDSVSRIGCIKNITVVYQT